MGAEEVFYLVVWFGFLVGFLVKIWVSIRTGVFRNDGMELSQERKPKSFWFWIGFYGLGVVFCLIVLTFMASKYLEGAP